MKVLKESNVTRVIGNPICENGMWGIKVEFNCDGIIDETNIFLDSKALVLKIKVGYKFLH